MKVAEAKKSGVQKLMAGAMKLEAESKEDSKGRRFRMLAYTGAPVSRYFGMAVFDLSSFQMGEKVPVLVNHDFEQRAGYADEISNDGKCLELAGYLSQATEAGRTVAQESDEGFPWQASIQVQPGSYEDVDAGQECEVNGRKLMGPLTIFRNNRLLESSFLPAGADKDTSGLALSAPTEETMDPKAFASKHPEAVEAWKQEGAKLAAQSSREGLSEMLSAFPGREGWAAKQWADGKSLLEAKAALSEVLQAELDEARAAAAKPAEGSKLHADEGEGDPKTGLAQLQAQARTPGVGFNGETRQAGDTSQALEAVRDNPATDLDTRIALHWQGSAKLQGEFGGNFNAFRSYALREGIEAATK